MIFTIAFSRIAPYYNSLREVINASCCCGPEYYPKRTKLKGYQKCKRRK
jgi:hypothetical protein